MAAATSKPLDGGDAISPDAVRAELERVLASDSFAGSKRLSAFLRFIVEQALADRLDEIKEYRIGSEVYGRGARFDPRIDNIVRVEAKRLRDKLRDYYERSGGEDSVRIEIPKGTYTPRFQAVPVRDKTLILPKPGITPAHPVSKPARRFPLGWAALVLVLAAACVFAYWHSYARGFAGKAHRSIAILGFKDVTGGHRDNAWLSTALSEMLTMDLAEGGQVRTVPVDSIAEMKRDLRLVDTDGLARETLNRVRGRAGADWVVVGAYTALGDQDTGRIRLDVRVQDTQSGDTVATLSETGSEPGLFDLADRTAMRLRQKLGLRAIPGGAAAVAALPSTPGAMRLYAEGLDRLRESNVVVARAVLERAVEADPSNPFVHSALAAAWDALGYEVRAQESAERAFKLASHLSRTEQLQIEGRFRTYAHEWNEAIRIYKNLRETEPDGIEDALMLVQAERLGSRPGEALATVESLRKLSSPLRDDPRIDFAEARVLGDLGNFRRARTSAISVERKALAVGAQLLYARARLFESGTMQNLGMPQAAAVREQARRLCADLGDRACVVQALRVEANQTLLSTPARAKELYEQGLAISREMGSRRESLNLLEGLGAACVDLDDLPEAGRAYAEGLATARETGNASGVNAFQMDSADVFAMEGRLPEADAIYQHAVSFTRSTGRRENLGAALTGFAKVLRLEGKREEARQAAEEAVRVLRPTGEAYETADALTVLGDCLLDTGDVEYARKNDEGAETLGGGARAEIALASALLQAHQAGAAASKAANAVRTFQAAKRVHDEEFGRAVLIRALLAQDKVSEALEVMREAPAKNVLDIYARLMFGLAAARAEAAGGSPGDALKQVSALMSEAKRCGYARVALEARLAYGEIEAQRSGLKTARRTRP